MTERQRQGGETVRGREKVRVGHPSEMCNALTLIREICARYARDMREIFPTEICDARARLLGAAGGVDDGGGGGAPHRRPPRRPPLPAPRRFRRRRPAGGGICADGRAVAPPAVDPPAPGRPLLLDPTGRGQPSPPGGTCTPAWRDVHARLEGRASPPGGTCKPAWRDVHARLEGRLARLEGRAHAGHALPRHGGRGALCPQRTPEGDVHA